MEYLNLFIACAFFSLQFVFQKLFKERTTGRVSVCFWNQMICGAVSLLFLVAKSGFPASAISPTAFLIVLAYAASGLIDTVTTITAMGCGRVATVSTFSLAGGMVVPFAYGVFALNEPSSLTKWLGLGTLCLSLVPTLLQKTEDKTESANKTKFIACCTVTFFFNGFVSVFSKMYMNYMKSTETDEAVLASAENNFVITAALIRVATAIVILVVLSALQRTRGEKAAFRTNFWEIGLKKMTGGLFALLAAFAGAYAVCNTLGNLFSLRCMDVMDASIQFPLLSAVVIVLTAVFGRLFFREKIGRETAISLVLSMVGIALFML